jgi:hypothetical protein
MLRRYLDFNKYFKAFKKDILYFFLLVSSAIWEYDFCERKFENIFVLRYLNKRKEITAEIRTSPK